MHVSRRKRFHFARGRTCFENDAATSLFGRGDIEYNIKTQNLLNNHINLEWFFSFKINKLFVGGLNWAGWIQQLSRLN